MLQYYDPAKDLDVSKDYGTPAFSRQADRSTELVSLTIDGRELAVPAGTSIMRAAALADISIPKLCATDSSGSVRILSYVSG